MLELDVYNMDGKKVDAIKIDEALFGGVVNKALLRDAVLMYQACARVGTACTKSRAEINATTRKPFRQKGTGRARQGSAVSPHYRGGGVALARAPRDYRYSIPKKARQAALKSAFLDKFQTATHVVDHLELDQPKTQQVARLLKNLNVQRTCLIATLDTSDSVLKSVRNIAGVSVKEVRDVNAYDLLQPRDLVVTRQALESVIERFSRTAGVEGVA